VVAAFDPRSADDARYAAVMQRSGQAGAIANAAAFAWVMEPIARPQRIEIAWLGHLDDYGRMMRVTELERGDHDSVEVCQTPRCSDVALTALDGRERYVILAHNHPRGWAQPSDADRALTALVREAMGRRGLRLLDHVILGHDQFFSFNPGGAWRGEGQLWQTRT
jgi:DNA repair protein RadC